MLCVKASDNCVKASDNNGRLTGDERPDGAASAGIAPVPVEEPGVMRCWSVWWPV
jgi:hypothetical protein